VAKEPAARFPTAEALVEAIDDARLAAPDVPVPIRLFAQELGTLSLVFVFLGMMSWLMLRAFSGKVGTAWAAIPGIFLGSIVFTRILQALAAARRLAMLGFPPDEVLNGLRATVNEREGLRQQLRVDPYTIRRRRNTLRAAAIMLPIALVLVQISLHIKWSLGVGARVSSAESAESAKSTLGNIVMAATGLSMLGICLLLFLRSPFKMPMGERLFRLVWLGPIGRGFVRVASRGIAPRGGTTGVGVTPVPSRVSVVAKEPTRAPSASPDRMASLEQRVMALERWRDGSPR
jgi:hypothetical protein